LSKRTIYSTGRKIADARQNPNNLEAAKLWLDSCANCDFGMDPRFYPSYLYAVENRRYSGRLGITVYRPQAGGSGSRFLRSDFVCKVYEVTNAYGWSMRAELPIGGAANWALFDEQLNRALLPFKMRCQ
jgi:hypothetical protein